MLGEKDLIFLGACLLLCGEAGKIGLHYLDNYDVDDAINRSQAVFNKIFSGEKSDEKMILD